MKKLWRPEHSVALSLAVTYLAGAGLLAMMCFAPVVLKTIDSDPQFLRVMGIVFYGCCPAGWLAVASLLKLLHNIRRGVVFARQNVRMLRVLSWCFIFVTLVSLGALFTTYLPMLYVFLGSGFLAVILRVVKNVMEQATIMKEEQELTI
jgi:hypothetical protein